MSLDQEIHVFDFIVVSNNTLEMIPRMWSPKSNSQRGGSERNTGPLDTHKFVMYMSTKSGTMYSELVFSTSMSTIWPS